jgi:cytochrome-b5 reductase
VVLIAAGTGITPLFQIARAILTNPANKAHVTILSFSTHDKDICLYQDLINLQCVSSAFCKLVFFASKLSAAKPRESVIESSTRSITALRLLQHVGDFVPETTLFCLSGPANWIAAARNLLEEGKVDGSRVLVWT